MTTSSPARPEPSRRARKTLTANELGRFFAALADTGNFALACDHIGRSKSGLYKRRSRDSRFAAECEMAIAQFRLGLSSPAFAGEVAARRADGGAPSCSLSVRAERRRGALLTQPGTLALSTHRGRPQIRRSPAGRLTRAGVQTFLGTLAATGNVRLAAQSVGVAHSSIYARRRRDPAFARDLDAALDCARAALEAQLIECADRSFGYEPEWLDANSPSPSGEGPGVGQSNEPFAGEGRGEGDMRFPTVTGTMTVTEAIWLVERLGRRR